MEIVWDEEAIKQYNDRLLDAIDSELAQTRRELDDARAEIERGKAELEEASGQAYEELAKAAGELSESRLQTILGQKELDAAPEELEATREQLLQSKASLEAMYELLEAKEQLDEGLAQVEAGLAELEEAEHELLYNFGSYAAAERILDETDSGLASAESELQEAYAAYQTALASGDEAAIAEAESRLQLAMQAAGTALQALAALGDLTGSGSGGRRAARPFLTRGHAGRSGYRAADAGGQQRGHFCSCKAPKPSWKPPMNS